MLPRSLTSRNHVCLRLLQRAITRCEGSLSSSHPGFEPRGAGHQINSVEKLVGYPTPLLSLRHLVGSEFNHLSEQIRRLLSSKHPVVKHASVLQESPQHSQTHGLITLLTSKAANLLNPLLPDVDQFGILPGQRVLAEVTEMINSALLLHMEVVSEGEEEMARNKEEQRQLKEDLAFGNKLVILGGDLLLARACRELAQLYVPKVVGLISDSISDMMTSSYWKLNLSRSSLSSSDRHNLASCTSDSLTAEQSCRFKAYQHHASLLRNSCVSASVLAELGPTEQNRIAEFGHHLGIAQEASKDKRRLISLTQLQQQQQSYSEALPSLVSWIDETCHHHAGLALKSLGHLPECDAVVMLDAHIHTLIDPPAS